MKTPFVKSLQGKFVLRTVLIALAVAAAIGGLAVFSMRSLTSAAATSVNNTSSSADAKTLAALETLADDVSSASSSLTLMVAVATVLLAIIAGLLALMFARKVTTPIVLLRNAAKTSTAVLPEIAQANVEGRELPDLPTIALSSGDELQDLADSIDHLQRVAAGLAVAEPHAALEPGVAPTDLDKLMDLGERSYSLVRRQMKLLEEIEDHEANPAHLQHLVQIDYLANRMRRNAESFLVLTGTTSNPETNHAASIDPQAVSMDQVVRAASRDIEHFDRISISEISGVSVNGGVVSDLTHLLTELLENATLFAPSDAMTEVGGRPTDHGYIIDIVDQGQGMTTEAIAAANTRLNGGAAATGEAVPGLGHEIVARLAQRHGVALRLSATPTGGLRAQVHVPQAALGSPAAEVPMTSTPETPAQTPEALVEAPAPAETAAIDAPAQAPPEAHVEAPAPAETAATAPAPPEAHVEAETAPVTPTEPPPAHVEAPAPAETAATVTPTEPPPAHVESETAPVTPTEPPETAATVDASTPDPAAVVPSEGETDAVVGERGLTSEQQAAIDWAIQQGSTTTVDA